MNKDKKIGGLYSQMFDQANDLIQQTDENIMVINANKKWLETLGYSKKDLGKIKLKDIVHPDHWNYCVNVHEKVIEGKKFLGLETVFITKDGREIELEANVSPVFNEKGEMVSTLGIFRDVTERNEAERKLKDRVEELEKINKLIIGRELKMRRLKEKVKKLKK